MSQWTMARSLWAAWMMLLASGCATKSGEGGFASVGQVVRERTGQAIHWNQGTDADHQATDRVHALLREELTPQSAVAIALLNNPSLQATYEELGIAQAEVVEAGLLQNPTFTAEVRFPRHAALPLEFDLTQSVIDLFLMPVRKRVAGAAFEAAEARVTAEVLSKASQTQAAFYRAEGMSQLVELRQNVVRATGASFDAARRLHDAGNISDLRLATERALYEQSKLDLQKAEANAQDAREELSGMMGVWGADVDWKLPPRLPELPEEEPALTGLESLAIHQRPDLQALRHEIIVSGENLGLSRFSMLGEFTIGGHFERDSDGTETAGPAVTVPLPLFNQGQGAIAKAQARYRQARSRYVASAVEIRAQVRRARNQLIAARDRARYMSRVILPLRHEIVEQSQLQFNGMFLGVFELLQAKQAEIEAGREYVESLTDYWVARAELERAIGGAWGVMPSTTQPALTTPDTTNAPAQHHH